MSPREKKVIKYCQTITKREGVKGTTYSARYELPPDPEDGSRRQVSLGTFSTWKEANAACAERAEAERKQTAVDPSRMTFADLTARWLAEEAKTSVRPQSLEDYQATIKKHVLPRLGTKRAQALTPSDISAFRAAVLASTGCRTAQLALTRVKQILGWGEQMELVQRNVAKGIREPKCPRREGYALSHDEARRFIEASFADALSPLWLVYLTTGFRRSEALGLRWRDVDFVRSTLTVRQQIVDRKRVLEIAEPKSEAARRTIEVDPVTMGHLERHQEAQRIKRQEARYWQDYDLVFCTGAGTPLHPNNLYRNFWPLVKAAGVYPDLTIHSLRHTHATHLILAGWPITEVSRRLGHEKVSITVDIYGSHLVAGRETRAGKAIQEMLFPELPLS